MAVSFNNHVFKGHKTLLGSKFVTYGEVELPTRIEFFEKSKSGFDWGNSSKGANQLAFSILFQVSNKELALEYAEQFTEEIVRTLNSRDWVLNSIDVNKWIQKNCDPSFINKKLNTTQSAVEAIKTTPIKTKKTNVVKDVCKELEITQKMLAEILEVPEGTISSWAVKNEIPRLGKKAIEFYIQNSKNQKIVESYKTFINLLEASYKGK